MMAGGLDLVDRLKWGEAVDRIVVLGGIDELRSIRREGDTVSIGALTTHAELAGDATLSDLVPDLPAIWRTLANPRVRYVGTIGGNLMSAKPHYDAWPALLALGADAVMFDGYGARSAVELSRLRECGEPAVLARLRIPVAPFRHRLIADRSLHPYVSVYLGISIAADTVLSARVAVGCAFLQAKVVALPASDRPVAALGSDAASLARHAIDVLPAPIGDGMASADYRRRMIEVLTRRLLIKMGSQP